MGEEITFINNSMTQSQITMLRSVTKVQPKDLGDGFAEVHLEGETPDDQREKGDSQEKEDKKNGEEKAETVGLFELYKFSDTTDKLVLALGVIMAIACGSLFSIMDCCS